MSMPDVLFLTQAGPTLPSARFRVLPYVEAGRARGLDLRWVQLPKPFFQRMRFLASLPPIHTIVVQKKPLRAFELALLRRRCQRLVFDFDDALWTSHPCSECGPGRDRAEAKARARLAVTLPGVDLVIAGNEYLAEYARPMAKRVEILPTPLDVRRYTPRPGRDASREVSVGSESDPAAGPTSGAEDAPTDKPAAGLTIGWMGAACNLFFLPPVLAALGDLPADARILVVSDKPPLRDPHPALEYEAWSSEREIEQLQAMDIGLMPLTDDEYTRGKCGFKLLQYMACGVAAVASPVGFNREIVQDGVTGLFADEPEDWARAIHRLLADAELRQRLTANGRRLVEERFSLEAAAERLWELLELPLRD